METAAPKTHSDAHSMHIDPICHSVGTAKKTAMTVGSADRDNAKQRDNECKSKVRSDVWVYNMILFACH